jgi:hypothetical protein
LQRVGLLVQEPPAVQETQDPEPLQTMLVPQLVPAVLFVPSTQAMAPLEQEVVPFLQMLELPVQVLPAVQGTQPPEPSQTRLVPQLVPADLLVPSTQVMAPVEQAVVPFLQAVGLPVQVLPAVQATQVPEPLHTMLLPQLMPGDLLVVSSTQVMAPVEQAVVPFLQAVGLPVQLVPAVHETQPPEPLHTMLLPQLVPALLAVPLTHVGAPVVHEAMPL